MYFVVKYYFSKSFLICRIKKNIKLGKYTNFVFEMDFLKINGNKTMINISSITLKNKLFTYFITVL